MNACIIICKKTAYLSSLAKALNKSGTETLLTQPGWCCSAFGLIEVSACFWLWPEDSSQEDIPPKILGRKKDDATAKLAELRAECESRGIPLSFSMKDLRNLLKNSVMEKKRGNKGIIDTANIFTGPVINKELH